MISERKIILAHIIRADLPEQPMVIKYQMLHLPKVGDEIRVSSESFYTVESIVWCFDEPDSPYTRVNIGVSKVDLSKPTNTGKPTNLRGIGRTTRMLQEALHQSNHGRAVYVVAANKAEQKRLREVLSEYSKNPTGISVETPESLTRTFNWKTLWSEGAHPNCVFLVDHFTIESEFSRMLHELHRYD